MRTPLPALVTAQLRARGRDADALLRRFDLPLDIDREPTVIVPIATLARFYDAAAIELDEPDLGVRLASTMPRGAYGVFVFGVRAPSTTRWTGCAARWRCSTAWRGSTGRRPATPLAAR
jgi:hypothetical protein